MSLKVRRYKGVSPTKPWRRRARRHEGTEAQSRFEKRMPPARSRRGSALLITLAVLGLLLIMAIYFSFDVRLSQKVAKNNTDAVRARLLHECGLSRAMAMIEEFGNATKSDNTFLNPAVSLAFEDGTSDWQGRRYFSMEPIGVQITDGLDTAFSTGLVTQAGFFRFTPNALNGSFSLASWDSVLAGSDVVGAYTYLIVDETGKLNPSRIGYVDSSAIPWTSLKAVNVDNAFGAPRTSYAVDSCFSQAHFALSIDATYLAIDSMILRSSFFPGTRRVAEEFWHDANDDSMCVAAEVHARMDLTQVGAGINAQQLYAFLLTCDSSASVDAFATEDSSLWLDGLMTADGMGPAVATANDGGVTARRYVAQLTANMMDSVDDGTDGTTKSDTPSLYFVRKDGGFEDHGGDYPLTSQPDSTVYESIVYGVESGFGLVGLNMNVSLGQLQVDSPIATWNTADVEAGMEVQLCNPFGDAIASVRVEVNYDVSISVTLSGIETPHTYTDVIQLTANPSSDYITIASDTQTLMSGVLLNTPPEVTLDTVTINSIKIFSDDRLTQSYPKFIDSKESHVAEWTPKQVIQASPREYYHMRVAAKDTTDILSVPRSPIEDTTAVYWQQDGQKTTVSSTSMFHTQTQVESNFTYSNEDYGSSICKNAVFASLGDLGGVHSPHTGGKSIRFWRTTLADGQWHDANLLDMFCTDKQDKHKVNINTRSLNVLSALTGNVDPTHVNLNNFSTNWLLKNGTNGGVPLMHRGSLHQFFEPNVVATATNDSYVDEAIGSFIELLDTRQNYYTVITCSRALQDIGTTAIDHKRLMKVGSRYAIVKGTFKSISAVYRDAWTGAVDILRTTELEK